MSRKVIKDVRPLVTEFRVSRNKSIHLLADGRLVNLSAATGHPASVMDMSFATQALAAEWIVKKGRKLAVAVHAVPKSIEDQVAKLKLHAMGVNIDRLSREQALYLESSGEGT
jgi:adenosylhomocysteinase